MQALFSLREFFRKGGDGGAVPEMFTVRPSSHGGGLNNFSCNFWRSAQTASELEQITSH